MTSIQRAMLQLQRHADFKDGGDPHSKAKADAYRHALQIVRLFTGEELPAAPVPLSAAKEAGATLPGFAFA